MLALLTAVLLSTLPMSQGVGKPRILVLPDTSAAIPAGFVEALRIQLAGIGAVEPGPAMTGTTVAAKVAHAVRAVDTSGAMLAVWIERAPTNGPDLEFVLYVVGRDQRHALIEVFRLTAADQPMIDRALALKVREVLDVVLDRAVVSAPVGWLDRDPVLRPTRLVLELGWSVAPGLGAPSLQTGPSLALGLRRHFGGVDADLLTSIRWVDGFSKSSFAGEVTTREVPLAIELRATHGSRPAVGAVVELGVRWIEASGVTPFGARGSISRWIPTGLAGVTAALPLRRGVELRTLLGVDLALHRLRLAVNEVEVLDLGRAHPRVDLTIAVTLP